MQEDASSEERIFEAALAIPDAAARARYLQIACGEDIDLRKRMDSLLAAYEKAGSFLETPPLPELTLSQIGPGPGQITEQPGDRVGRYKLLQKVGEGGM